MIIEGNNMNKKYEIYALLLVIYSAVHLMVVFAHDNPIYIRINSLFFFISVLCFLFTWYKNSNNVIKIDLKIRDLEIKVRSLNQCIDEKDAFYNSLINKTNQAAIQIASLLADHALIQFDISEKYLKRKSRPAHKEAQRIEELKMQARLYIEQYKMMLYKYEMLLNLFPELSSYVDDLEAIKLLNSPKNVKELVDDFDRVNNWVSKQEYELLSVSDRNQLALDRYLKGQKTNWQIGRDYELYCAYMYREFGWNVLNHGIEKQLNDMGRDLICTKGSVVNIVQCKLWSQSKVIHEKHIAQLYGSTIEWQIENEENSSFKFDKIQPVFITNIELSETAKKFAKRLNVVVYKWQLQEFPRIKCNVNNGSRIYHLPFDQQYDATKIEGVGEFYAMSVKEAEAKGFRRAFRWQGNNGRC